MGGMFGGGTQTSTTTQELSPEQRKILELSMPWLEQFAAQGIELPSQRLYTGFNPTQKKAQNMALNAVPGMRDVAQTNKKSFDFLSSGDLMDVNKNPYFKGNVKSVQRPLFESYLQQLSQAGDAATQSGQFGSSRHAILQGEAGRGYSDAMGDATSRMATNIYDTGLSAKQGAMSLAPMIQAGMLAPAKTVSAVGDIRANMQQMMRQEAINKFLQQQYLPLSIGQSLAGIVGGMPGGSMNTETQMPGQSPFMQILGMLFSGMGMFGGI